MCFVLSWTSDIVYRPIGVVHSPFKVPRDVPIQSAAAEGVTGTVEVSTEYVEGLKDVEGFSYLILIYHCHLAQEYSLLVRPFLDKQLHGVFATRAPSRPNSIGLSVVRLARIDNNLLHIQDVDIIDGTPLLDIKPFVPKFDQRKAEKIGWLTGNVDNMHQRRDDGRFAKDSNM
jgi:tRNA-Thr(GGU) m(6)t(6)A37 methyltransferase TsaA